MTKNKIVIDYLQDLIIEAIKQIKFHQDLIDEWNDPKDIATRACEMVKKTHRIYALSALITMEMLEKKSAKKFLKKM